MARLFMSGAEFNDATDGGIWDSGTWTTPIGAAMTGERGFKSSPAAGTQFGSKQYLTNISSNNSFHKFDMVIVSSVDTQSQIITLTDTLAGGDTGSIRINTNNTLELWNENTPGQIGSDSVALVTGTKYRIELGYIFGTRVLTGYINGVSFASGALDAAFDQPTKVHVGLGAGLTVGIAVTGEISIDDYACNDQTAGGTETGLVGEEHIVLRMVDAAGDNSQGFRFGTDSGSDFGQLNQKPPDDATTGYQFDTNNDILDLGIEGQATVGFIPPGSKIKLVQVQARHRLSAGTNALGYNARIKSQASGTVGSGTTKTHNDITWQMNGDALPRIASLTSYTDPQTGQAWSIARLEDAQIGILCNDANGNMQLTTLAAYIGFKSGVQDLILTGGIIPFPRIPPPIV